MAKDALGHGSEARVAPMAPMAKQAGIRPMAKQAAMAKQAPMAAMDSRVRGVTAPSQRYAEANSEPQVQANRANQQAGAALAQGHPKSAPVPVHASMRSQFSAGDPFDQGMLDHPAHSRIGGG